MIKSFAIELKIRFNELSSRILTKGVFLHEWKIATLSTSSKPNKCRNELEVYRIVAACNIQEFGANYGKKILDVRRR